MPVQPNDHALVIGIGRYPGFGSSETESRDLQGPDQDAQAIYDWLVAPDKGGVPEANAKLIRTADLPAAPVLDAQPSREKITREFDRLESSAQNNHLHVGRRLYVYVSGHGFARKRNEGFVYLANATQVRTHNLFASGWIEWFYNAEYFDELVLWMDCCMVFNLAMVPDAAGFRNLQAPAPTSRLFTAYAAKFPRQAVERPMPDGSIHGVFTYALLKGLNGDAADPTTGEVTSATLRSHLTSTMRTHLNQVDLNDNDVAKEPDFGFDDPMVFTTVAAAPKTNVTLTRFPAAAEGRRFVVVTGAPQLEVESGNVVGGAATVKLRPGVYFVKVDAPTFQKGFEVLGGASATIDLG